MLPLTGVWGVGGKGQLYFAYSAHVSIMVRRQARQSRVVGYVPLCDID